MTGSRIMVFIDATGSNIVEKNIWFIRNLMFKTDRDIVAFNVAKAHKSIKEHKWKECYAKTGQFYETKVKWEWNLIQRAWNIPGDIFSINRIQEEIMAAVHPRNLIPTTDFLDQFRDFWRCHQIRRIYNCAWIRTESLQIIWYRLIKKKDENDENSDGTSGLIELKMFGLTFA